MSVTSIEGSSFDLGIKLEFEDGSPFYCDNQSLLYNAAQTQIFARISNLESYEIPSTVQSFSFGVFAGYSGLRTINFKPDSQLSSISYELFSGCINLQEFIFPNTITSIGVNGFQGCNSLRVLYLPDNLIEIAKSGFANCEGLTEVHFKNVTKINDAFGGCTALETIIFEGTQRTILYKSFSGCTNLKTVISVSYTHLTLPTTERV